MSNKEEYHCRICGLDQDEPLWGADGKSAKYIICECCGAESGIQDYCLEACREYRKKWLSKGGVWIEPEYMPDNWSLEEQLKFIPSKFL